MRQNRELLRGGLQKAGISDDTLNKLKIFDEFAVHSGEFLVASLDLTHRMMVYNTVALFERAEYIKKNYLENELLDDEIKVQWQECYNEICDIIGKGYDRTLNGTQAMARMIGGGDDGKKKKRKPKFGALRKAAADG
ncbi:MAG: hypothetical protein KIT44_13570 [Opitutaceae bacterium]|nr:hypothetical protein [Opitutaceae bacterium]